jgi:hypothetical protein
VSKPSMTFYPNQSNPQTCTCKFGNLTDTDSKGTTESLPLPSLMLCQYFFTEFIANTPSFYLPRSAIFSRSNSVLGYQRTA